MGLKLIGCFGDACAMLCESCLVKALGNKCGASWDRKIYELVQNGGEECKRFILYGCIADNELHECKTCGVRHRSLPCMSQKNRKEVFLNFEKEENQNGKL